MNILIRDDKRAESFASLFQYLRFFGDKIVLHFDPQDGMFMQGMDTSHVSIAEIRLQPDFFEGFVCTERVEIAVGTAFMYRILNSRKSNQVMQLMLNPQHAKLVISFSGDSKTTFNKEYELPLLAADHELLQIPECEYQAEFALNSANFASMVQQMQLFGDSAKVQCTDEHILWQIQSSDAGSMKVEIEIADLDEYAIEEDEHDISASFSLRYLSFICQYHKLSPKMQLCLSRNVPLKVQYTLGSGGTMIFYLAPKLGDEEEENTAS
jgi:proliferating cell nuclear antigen